MTLAFVGLGSNLNCPDRQLDVALAALDRMPGTRVLERSSRYRTDPVGDPDQPEFLNAVVALETDLDAHELLGAMQAIERDQGRDRDPERPCGPRTIDLDLLLFGDESIRTSRLTVPHPRLHQRAFVLCPLAEIAPDRIVPGRGPVAGLRQRVDDAGVRPADHQTCP